MFDWTRYEDCPKCGAKRGVQCWDTRYDIFVGGQHHVRNPHKGRKYIR